MSRAPPVTVPTACGETAEAAARAGWEERITVLKDDSVKNPVFRPLNYVELLMYTDLQPENGYVWVNTACAEYYGKESVTVAVGMAGE